jgi:type II secretory pathway component PulM
MSAWRTRWNGLARRERLFLTVGGAIVTIALVFVGAIEPAWRDRARLSVELPALRDAAAKVEALRDTAIALRGRGQAVESGAAMRDAARAALARAAIPATAELGPDGALVVTARAVPAAAWMPWVEAFARDARLRIASARVAATSAPGVVDADVRFAAPAR